MFSANKQCRNGAVAHLRVRSLPRTRVRVQSSEAFIEQFTVNCG